VTEAAVRSVSSSICIIILRVVYTPS